MTKKKAAFTINNKLSSLKQIRHAGQEDSLRRVLGDYISGKEVYRAGISYSILRSWRSNGRLRARKIKATWFYSRQDLLGLIKAESDSPSKSPQVRHRYIYFKKGVCPLDWAMD